MFYSHEVLTSRKYGVATVWLVATLGSKSQSKKINRKAILDVNVPKACQTIVDPAAPMALRLQGNLLYGVTRVWQQQAQYVLSDAKNASSAMYLMLKAVKNAGLDPDAGKARPEQLVLQDDPSFLPEFALTPPELLAELNLGPAFEPLHNGDSQSLTPFGSQQAPTTPEALGGGLVIPSSSSIGPGEFNIQGDYGPDSFGGPSSIVDVEGIDQMLDEPDFVINDDGTVIDPPKANTIPRTPAAPRGATMHSDAGASAQVRQEHEEGVQAYAPQTDNQMDLDLPILNDDLPEGEAFPTAPIEQPSEVAESSSPVVAANSRKRRAARALPIDATMELRNKDLADWSTNYLTNMKAENEHKHKKQLARIAKKNAEYWVWGAGIGGIASRLGGTSGPTPFDRFIGDNLFEFFTGVSPKRNAGAKRDRDSGIDEATQAESRRVRQKTGEPEEEMGRGQEDEAMFIPGGDEVELPREAPSALDDQQIFSAMPWNMSASLRGSSAVPRSAQVGIIGSAAPPSSLTGRRGSRMISASPLHGRGQSGGLEALQGFDEAEDEFGNIASDDFGFAGPGPSSDVPDDPHAEPIARVREALSAEGENFLIFVADGIDEKRSRVQAGLEPMSDVLQADAVANTDEVTFEELLPPTNNSKMVAASALVMTLTLGTKGLLNVRQDDDFEEIGLSLTEKGKAVLLEMPAEEVDAEEGAGEEQQEEGGHFEEQFAAAHGGDSENDGEDDDDDSLYAN